MISSTKSIFLEFYILDPDYTSRIRIIHPGSGLYILDPDYTSRIRIIHPDPGLYIPTPDYTSWIRIIHPDPDFFAASIRSLRKQGWIHLSNRSELKMYFWERLKLWILTWLFSDQNYYLRSVLSSTSDLDSYQIHIRSEFWS